MGLDMYLYKKHYIGNKYRKAEDKVKVITPEKIKIIEDRITEITENVAYWRKANAIHDWFVKNCVDSEDWHGDDAYVSYKDLQKLLATVKEVLAASKMVKAKVKNGSRSTKNGWEPIIEDGEIIEDSTVAQKLLPTAEGFFFGSQDYDQWYIADLKETEKQLEELLAEPNAEDGSYYYSASW